MRQINEARRHRVLSLSTRLKAINDARRELLRQLEDLDAEAKSVSLERNILHNLDAPISNIPDEILTMIFEEGIRPRQHGHRFGVVLSHVSHHWRNVAITTPKLWTYLWLQHQSHDEIESPELRTELERARAFLSRSRLCPVDIYVIGFEDISPEFIQLIGEHVGHCRELCARIIGGESLLHQLLECFSSNPIPLLSSIDLASHSMVELPVQLFAHGAPRLTTVQLENIKIPDVHLHLAAFSSVTCLQLTAFQLNDSEEYGSFRDCLMALPSLHHLEFQMYWFEVMLHHLPIVLPTIQFLHIDASDCPEFLGPLISIIHAASLATLSLTVWASPHVDSLDGLELQLPSLKHLILAEDGGVEDIVMIAQTFPDIERLSVEIMADRDLDIVLRSWPKLQTIAISEFEELGDAHDIHSVVFECQDDGHAIRRLMLPEAWLLEAGAEDVIELRKLVVVERYYVDWPKPFKWEYSED